jgi:Flp pilus assembly protein TadG
MTRAAVFLGSGRAPAAGNPKVSSRLRSLRLISPIHRTLRAEAGATMVEFAMASVILFTLVFGVIAICLALYSYNVVSEAAREATRYAIVRGSACNSFSDCKVTQAQLQTYVQNLGFPGMTPSSLGATASWPNGNNNPGSPVQVTVTYTFPLIIPFVPRRTLRMSSTSQMVISQ